MMSKDSRQIARAWTLILQMGLTVIGSVLLCVAVGLYLDHQFGWYTTVPLLVLGLLSGLQSAYRMAGALVGKNDKDDLAGVYDRLEREKLAEKQKRNSVSDVE